MMSALNAIIAKVLVSTTIASGLCLSMLSPLPAHAMADSHAWHGAAADDCCQQESQMDHTTDAVVATVVAKSCTATPAIVPTVISDAPLASAQPRTAFTFASGLRPPFSLTGIVIKRE